MLDINNFIYCIAAYIVIIILIISKFISNYLEIKSFKNMQHSNHSRNLLSLKSGGNDNKFDFDQIKKYFNTNDLKTQLLKIIKNNDPVDPIKYLSDISEELDYRPFNKFPHHNCHVGQLKLFLTELEFLTHNLKSNKDQAIVIYIGSAPSHKLSYLAELFPNIKFVLVDPEEHLIKYGDKHSYNKEYMNETLYFTSSSNNRFNKSDRNINMWVDGDIKQFVKELDMNKIEKYNEDFIKNVSINSNKIIDTIINTNFKYYIIESLFTDELAYSLKNLNNFLPLYFISDIRTNLFGMLNYIKSINQNSYINDKFIHKTKFNIFDEEDSPSDIDVIWNNALQLIWLNIMQPTSCMLKFRCPFFNTKDIEQFKEFCNLKPFSETFDRINKEFNIDIVADYFNKKYQYIKNDCIYIQGFPGHSSSETRLIAHKYNIFENYDYRSYENKLFYYNNVIRAYRFNPKYKQYFDKRWGIDGCNDCTLTIDIFNDYIIKYKYKDNPKNMLIKLLKMINRQLKCKGVLHGELFAPLNSIDNLIDKQKKYLKI